MQSMLALAALFFFSILSLAQTNTSRHWEVATAGAAGDGKTDATAIFQRLLDEAGQAGGGIVEVPAGQFRIDGHLSIPANVTLQGIYRVPPTTGPVPMTNLTGSVLYAYAGRGSTNGQPFIRLAGNNSAIAGLIIAYPDWKQSDVPPVPYPPCVQSRDTENVGVRDCLLLNPYEGIHFVRAHRHLIRNVTGYPIQRGIFVDECYDIGHIENVHFWPFGVSYDPANPYCLWVNTHGIAFELARTDWHYVFNTFCFGYGVGYKFSQSKTGSSNGNFLGLGADSCERAVVVEQAQAPGLLISNGEFVGRWSSTNAICVEVAPGAEGKVSLVNCSFWGPIDRCIWMRATNGWFSANACHFVSWDNRSSGAAAIQADAGRVSVQGCSFGEENLDVQVGSAVTSAILTGNQAAGGFRFENQAGARTQAGFNEADNIAWTEQTRAHYRIEVGAAGDGRFLKAFHGQERGARSYRWTSAQSQLLLPVPVGKKCVLVLEADIPPQAVNETAGLYLGETLLAGLKAGRRLVAELPASQEPRVRLELRCAAWVPAKVHAGSHDQRQLGLQLFTITVQAEDAAAPVFDANRGTWLDQGTGG